MIYKIYSNYFVEGSFKDIAALLESYKTYINNNVLVNALREKKSNYEIQVNNKTGDNRKILEDTSLKR